jgi:nucleoside-diphosphate-sugar epimerase
MRTLVTGGAGLVGSEIVDLLLDQGHEVISLDNYVSGKKQHQLKANKNPNFTSIGGDIRDTDLLKNLFESKIDWVFHEAVSKNTVCLTDPLLDLDVNARGTLNLLLMSRDNGVSRFVHASTGSVYGHTEIFPTSENDPKNPISFYGNSKLCAENYVQQFHSIYGLPTVILRYYHVFGSRQDSGPNGAVVPIFCRQALNGENLFVTGDGGQIRALTHVSDVARINLKVAETEKSIGQIYNCASDNRITILNLAKEIIAKTESKTSEILHSEERFGEIYKFDVNNSKLKSDLNFDFKVSVDSGLTTTIEEMKMLLNPKSN